ncbi:MAG: YihY/virulence factor BrkB family protein [Thermomicrobiales bacterium]
MKITQVEWGKVSKAAIKEYGKDDIAGLAAEMAYWIVFSLFPFIIFMATLTGIINRFTGADLYTSITNSLFSVLDSTTAETLRKALEQVVSPQGGALSIGVLIGAVLTLNSASSAVDTTMKAFNRAYGVEETRNFIIKKLTSLALTLALILLIIGGAVFLAIGGDLVAKLGLGSFATILLSGLRVVGALAAMSLGLAVLYWKGPNIKQQFQWISPGSLIATLALVVFAGAFSLYVRFFAGSSINKTYGTLAGVILFLMFLRFASTIILLGAEFNAEAAMRYDSEAIRDKVNDQKKVVPGEQPHPHPQAAREAGLTPGQVVAIANNGGGTHGYGKQVAATTSADFADADIEDRLRSLRERPITPALPRVVAERERRSPSERAAEGKAVLVALGASLAAAVVSAVTGTLRRAHR